jgi:hypothetical protein
MLRRFCLAMAFVPVAACTKQARVDAMMTWTVDRRQKLIVLRFVEDPDQGITEEWSPELQARLLRLGNPVRVTFDCWRQFGGTFGFNPIALNGKPYYPGGSAGPSRGGAFSEGEARPNPLEFSLPR